MLHNLPHKSLFFFSNCRRTSIVCNSFFIFICFFPLRICQHLKSVWKIPPTVWLSVSSDIPTPVQNSVVFFLFFSVFLALEINSFFISPNLIKIMYKNVCELYVFQNKNMSGRFVPEQSPQLFFFRKPFFLENIAPHFQCYILIFSMLVSTRVVFAWLLDTIVFVCVCVCVCVCVFFSGCLSSQFVTLCVPYTHNTFYVFFSTKKCYVVPQAKAHWSMPSWVYAIFNYYCYYAVISQCSL